MQCLSIKKQCCSIENAVFFNRKSNVFNRKAVFFNRKRSDFQEKKSKFSIEKQPLHWWKWSKSARSAHVVDPGEEPEPMRFFIRFSYRPLIVKILKNSWIANSEKFAETLLENCWKIAWTFLKHCWNIAEIWKKDRILSISCINWAETSSAFAFFG